MIVETLTRKKHCIFFQGKNKNQTRSTSDQGNSTGYEISFIYYVFFMPQSQITNGRQVKSVFPNNRNKAGVRLAAWTIRRQQLKFFLIGQALSSLKYKLKANSIRKLLNL